MATNWDTKTADTCKIRALKPEWCKDCRTYAYCYKYTQMTIEELLSKAEKDGAK